jgi:serine phosphatase RsbU (regulator of sigma subunit)
MNKRLTLLLLLFVHAFAFSQSKSEIILNRASELFNKNYNQSFDLCCQAEQINNVEFIGEVCLCKARYYLTFTDYVNAETEISKAISFFKNKNDIVQLSNAYNLKSILLGRLGEEKASLKILVKAYQLSKKSGDFPSIIKRLINLSFNFSEVHDLPKAQFYLAELEELIPRLTKSDLFYFYQNKGWYYLEANDYQNAVTYFQKGLVLAIEENMIDSHASILNALSLAYSKQNQWEMAEQNALKSIEVSTKNKLIFEKSEALSQLINIYESKKEFVKAFKLQKEFIALEKTILNTEKLNRVAAIQNRLALAEKENIITKQNNKISDAKLKTAEFELKNQKLYVIIFIVLAVFIFLFFVYFRTKRLSDVIQIQKKEVDEKNLLVETQNKDIKDSIKYAERIQHAILPPTQKWQEKALDSFVYFLPKDVLSGDFYWIEESTDFTFIAAADCTGHGVPGALISIVNYNLLNKAVLEKGIEEPGKILDAVNNWLTDSLHQTATNSTVKDGMDVALIAIHKKTKELSFAGAFNPLLIVREGQIIELKGDKFPVGAFINEEKQLFCTQKIQLLAGDMLYLFTDGYADQFGGEKDKKFKTTQLKQTFLEIHALPIAEQKDKLNTIFTAWKSTKEQVDDVLIIGVKM